MDEVKIKKAADMVAYGYSEARKLLGLPNSDIENINCAFKWCILEYKYHEYKQLKIKSTPEVLDSLDSML